MIVLPPFSLHSPCTAIGLTGWWSRCSTMIYTVKCTVTLVTPVAWWNVNTLQVVEPSVCDAYLWLYSEFVLARVCTIIARGVFRAASLLAVSRVRYFVVHTFVCEHRGVSWFSGQTVSPLFQSLWFLRLKARCGEFLYDKIDRPFEVESVNSLFILYGSA